MLMGGIKRLEVVLRSHVGKQRVIITVKIKFSEYAIEAFELSVLFINLVEENPVGNPGNQGE